MSGTGRKAGWAALLATVPLAIVLGWSQPSGTPSRAELAQALSRSEGKAVRRDEIRSIACEVAPDARGYACRWRQRDGEAWRNRSGLLAPGAGGWRLSEAVPQPR